jgi:hypothetical protein
MTGLTVYVIGCKCRNLPKNIISGDRETKQQAYEIVTMVITFLAPDAHLNFVVSCIPGRFQKSVGTQLRQEIIRCALTGRQSRKQSYTICGVRWYTHNQSEYGRDL